MNGLKVISRSGGATTPDELVAANRIAITHKEMRFGVVKLVDKLTGVEVEYHPLKKIAYTSIKLLHYFYSRTIEPACNCRSLNVFLSINRNIIPNGPITAAKVTAYLSDGTLLAEIPLSFVNSPVFVGPNIRPNYISRFPETNPLNIAMLQPSFQTPLGGQGGWRGDNTIKLYTPVILPGVPFPRWDGTSLSPAGELTFELPEDVCPPTVPNSYAEYGQAVLRHRIFKKACSDSAIASLEAGQLPDNIRYGIKAAHPNTSKLYVPPVSISRSESIEENTVGPTSTRLKIKNAVTVSYTLPPKSPDVAGEPYTITYEGYVTINTQLAQAGPPSNGLYAVSYSTSFENFPVMEANQNSGRARMDPNSLIFRVPLPSNYTGPAVTGNPFPQYLNNFQNPDKFALYDKTMYELGVALNGETEGLLQLINTPYIQPLGQDYLGNQFSPDIPRTNTDNVSRTHLSVISGDENNFRKIYPPEYLESPPVQFGNLLDARLTDKETITIYPIQYRSDTLGDLGLYPQPVDSPHITGIYLTKGYKFEYDETNGSYEFKGTTQIADKDTGEPTERMDFSVTQTFPNFIFKSSRRKTGWDDVDQIYAFQPDAIKEKFDRNAITLDGLYDLLQKA